MISSDFSIDPVQTPTQGLCVPPFCSTPVSRSSVKVLPPNITIPNYNVNDSIIMQKNCPFDSALPCIDETSSFDTGTPSCVDVDTLKFSSLLNLTNCSISNNASTKGVEILAEIKRKHVKKHNNCLSEH